MWLRRLKGKIVERSGQGMNLIYELSIQQAKLLPDFAGTDRSHVCISLDGLIQDPQLLTMMERIGMETLQSFNTADFLVVHCIHKEQKVPAKLQDRLKRLLDLGIIERIARGRFILGKRYYVAAGKQGVYTRKRGLDRETNKALLLKHIRENTKTGSQMNEFYQVLPGLSRSQIQVLLRELKADGRICVCGSTNAALWFVVI